MRCGPLLSMFGIALLVGANVTAAADEKIDFAGQVAPLLEAKCFDCHAGGEREGGLRLDRREDAFNGGDNGRVIRPGAAAKSELISRVSGTSEGDRMPPGDPLSAEQIELLRKWVEQGAEWPEDSSAVEDSVDHWSFQPIERLAPPEVSSETAHSPDDMHPVDAFVRAKLNENGISPSPQADRITLIRRVYLDLLGLPPTPAEVDEFVADPSPNAYEKLIDRVLASPHFGERWGRHWLDKARYADSDGYEKDRPRKNAWRYRDWVIDAVNEDMPIDQFTIEQLAGDLLPEATPLQQLATAFHRQTLTNNEGGVDQEEYRVAAVFDRVETTGAVWLGLTVGCARCHTHKFDPLTQREYYELYSFFDNGDEKTTTVAKSEDAVRQYEIANAKHKQKLAELTAELHQAREEVRGEFQTWQAERLTELTSPQSARYHLFDNVVAAGPAGLEFERLADGSLLASGKRWHEAAYEVATDIPADVTVTGLKLEVMPHESLPGGGPGRGDNGAFMLNMVTGFVTDMDGKQTNKAFTVHKQQASKSRKGLGADKLFTKGNEKGWSLDSGETGHIVLPFREPLELQKDERLHVTMHQYHGAFHLMGRLRLSYMTGDYSASELPERIRTVLSKPLQRRSEQENGDLFDYFASRHPKTDAIAKKIDAFKKKAPESPYLKVRVIGQREKKPRQTHMFRRGDFLQPLDPVNPAGPAALPSLKPRDPATGADRLDLARWLVSPENPLTARVFANHVWLHLFGTGIVRTPNDFGTQGERPTHPELLDWLASELRDNGWSRKGLIRTILLSQTYRRSSAYRPDLEEIDATNLLLARQNRFRVEGEIIRDVSLAAAGLLSRKVGGPSVFPPMPADVAALSYANQFKWSASDGEDRYRRGMYTFFKRTAPHPNLMTFDCPDANTTSVSRLTSNTPLQALQTLNNVVYLEAAQALGEVMQQSSEQQAEAIETGFRRCVGRAPSEFEVRRLKELYQSSLSYYEQNLKSAAELVGEEEGKSEAENKAVADQAAWIAVARVLLNLDEFLVRS
ncbi:PSD1 and planctomycete cytochrome C domain-containing protein [Stratiformator vulcanicus]|uniref:Planctomycete cytochrome C n=1 Tax=Stratiformator vulcanicus TaxID=2527980 RepID=A0A517R0P0_9PLAN|nr:PSD1 and planctomycete cytochrome C domain-containing protein [Stratiformator vulcanicus]QDT37400.1 Planctomycete cytochrome C [Stratiformator vulcanicus]